MKSPYPRPTQSPEIALQKQRGSSLGIGSMGLNCAAVLDGVAVCCIPSYFQSAGLVIAIVVFIASTVGAFILGLLGGKQKNLLARFSMWVAVVFLLFAGFVLFVILAFNPL